MIFRVKYQQSIKNVMSVKIVASHKCTRRNKMNAQPYEKRTT